MKKKQEVRGMMILGISVVITYFFTWKNFQEYRKYTVKKEEYLQKVILQKREYREKKHQLQIIQNSIPKIKTLKKINYAFSHVLEFESFLYRVLEKYQLHLDSLGRIQKEKNTMSIPGIVHGKIYDILSFLQEIENYSKRICLSNQYWKLEKNKYQEGVLKCNFTFYIEEGAYDFSDIVERTKVIRSSFVHFSKKETE